MSYLRLWRGKSLSFIKQHRQALLAIGWALAIKTVVLIFMLTMFAVYHEKLSFNSWNRFYNGEYDVSAWYLALANWDAQHYLSLAERGYRESDLVSSAFYPLYPLVLRALSFIFAPLASLYVVAIALGYICSAGFLWYVYRLSAHLGIHRPHLPMFIVLCFPTAFYLSAFYAESLFLWLQFGFIYHFMVTKSRTRLFFLAILPLVKGNAIFVFGGMLLYQILETVKAKRNSFNRLKEIFSKLGKRTPSNLSSQEQSCDLPAATPANSHHLRLGYYVAGYGAFVLGVIGYLLFYTVATGDPLAGLYGQQVFLAENRIENLFNPFIVVRNLTSSVSDVFQYVHSLHDKIFLGVFLLGIVVFIKRREWLLLCFYFPIVWAHASMGIGLASYSRYMLHAIPLLALVLVKHCKHVWLLYIMCALLFVVQLYFALYFSLNLWIA